MKPMTLSNSEIYQKLKPVLDQLDLELLKLRQQPLAVEHKKGVGSQAAVVTAADRFADEFLRTELKQLFPEYGFVTEEGEQQATEEFVWIIDPIDGTGNYAHGLDMFGVSIGLWRQDGTSVFGLIDLPARSTRIWGGKGLGVWLNGERLQQSELRYPEKPLILLAPIWKDPAQAGAVTQSLADQIGHTRDHGCSSWQSFLVLTGKAEAALHFRLSIWDIAAAVALAEELGLSVVFSANISRSELINSVNQPVTIAIGHPSLTQKLIDAVAPWTN